MTADGISISRGNDRQWTEVRSGRIVTITEHPIRAERVEFLNEPEDPTSGPLTLKFYLESEHVVDIHTHPLQTETITVNEGSIRARIDGETTVLDVGDHRRISPGIPHGYEVVGDEEAVLAVSMTPALDFKDFIIAEHALPADAYPASGVNLPYAALVARRFGPMIAPPVTGIRFTLLLLILTFVARIRRLRIPDEPLPIRENDPES